MIKINKIEPPKWEAFDPESKSLGFLNYFEFNDLRIQIKKHFEKNGRGNSGYYFISKDINNSEMKINITNDGRCTIWPKGFYDLMENQLMELL